jgi:cyanophycin synthetase
LVEGLLRLQLAAGWQVNEAAVLEGWQPQSDQTGCVQAVVLVPGPMPLVLNGLLPALLQALNDQLHAPAEPSADALDAWLKALARWAPGGTNNRHFLREAVALGMPVLALPGGVFQLGWGRRARLFKSSISDTTTAIATAWAKDKGATHALLRMAGFPVPVQRAVASLDAALKTAQQIGYPVVLKPVNLDQGLGVEADLRNEAELRAAYERSVKFGRPLVLEQHVQGEDYRVYTMDGELLAVAHRIPAQVVGDGVATVAQLVAQTNEQRLSLDSHSGLYKPIELDSEALDLMSRESLTPASVLPAGRVLRLRRTANVSRGGMSVDMTHLTHPDNAALCVQVAALLRLDLPGLDLLMPDITRSWREVGAAFCEVNAQPQMGGANPWIFERILRRYVRGQGRVPAVLVLGPSGEPVLGRTVARALGGVGWSTTVVQGRGMALIERTRAAVMQPGLGAVVVQTDGEGLAVHGLPLDRFDVLVICGCTLAETVLASTLDWVTRHVSGVVVWDARGANSVADSGWQALVRWSALQAPLNGRDAQPLSRLQQVDGPAAVAPVVLHCVQALCKE